MPHHQNVYEMITSRIITLLEKGTIPWRKPWNGGDGGLPMNLNSNREYRGINVFLLSCMGFGSRYWLSFKQAKDRGGFVRKREKSTPVIFWKRYEVTDTETGEVKEVPVLRYYSVFNLDQIEGVDAPDAPVAMNPDFEPITEAERIIRGMPQRPTIQHAQPRAFYRSGTDTVNLPQPELFAHPEAYYSTAFHELTHATGHESRLNRRPSTEIRHFGDKEYIQEELVAEMGSAFLCAQAGIEQTTLENSAAYIANWLQVLKASPKMVVIAAAQAQKATDFILDRHAEN